MKVAKVTWGKIYAHAYKAGLTVVKMENGTYSIFDMKMKYFTHKNLTKDDVVRIVQDEHYMIAYAAAR